MSLIFPLDNTHIIDTTWVTILILYFIITPLTRYFKTDMGKYKIDGASKKKKMNQN